MGLRGIFHVEVKVSGPRSDLHSGVFGGVVKNPAIELSKILAGLHAVDGAIAIPGFYDGIPAPTEQEQSLLAPVQVNLEGIASKLGCALEGGERQYSFHERRGLRPTLEVNGMWSGYMGPGSKTIIPSFACVKITGRTVRGQDPERSMKLLEKFLQEKTPSGVSLEITSSYIGGPAVSLDVTSDLLKRVKTILEKVSGERVEVVWEGGSIPVVAGLSKVSGASPLLVGFALDDDNLHAPNESFSIDQFKLGFKYAYQLLRELSA